MTFDPSAPVPQPPAPQPSVPQAPMPQVPAPAPRPAQPKGFAGALTAAIIVSALPLILIPAMTVWMVFAFASAASSTSDGYFEEYEQLGDDPYAEGPLDEASGADLPIDLPWDLDVDGDAYLSLSSTFPGDPAWTPTTTGGNSGEFTSTVTGCTVWYTNGSDGSDALGEDDRTASLSRIEQDLGSTIDRTTAYDVALISGDGVSTGTADAVAIDVQIDRYYTVISRSITDLGEGVVMLVGCDAPEQLPGAVVDAAAHLTVGLVSTEFAE